MWNEERNAQAPQREEEILLSGVSMLIFNCLHCTFP